MTMPNERMRALRLGRGLLEQLLNDPLVPDALRSRARELQPEYPGQIALELLVASGTHGLSHEMAGVFSDSKNLFFELQAVGLGSRQTRQQLRFAMRHFPDHWEIGAMEQATSLTAWLQPDGRRM